MTREELLKRVKEEVPNSSGVYIMKNQDDEVIYVGKAKILKRRMKSYFDETPKTVKTYALIANVFKFDYILTNSELDAFSLENNLIKKYKPRYNILLKDDKSFPYLKIDFNERFPRLQIVRRPKLEKNVQLFGPYVTGTRISELVGIIKSAYPIRWCNKNFDDKSYLKKPCLYGEIGKCVAPCLCKENEQKYKEVLNDVVDFLNGKTGGVKKTLKEKMDSFAESLNFEDALIIRNQITSIENIEKELITSLTTDSNIDVFGISELDETYCINVITIRNGNNIGQVNYPVYEVVGTKNDILMSFISNYYKMQVAIPKEIVTSELTAEEKELLAGFLLVNYNKFVKINVPKIAVKKELVSNAEKNALEFLLHFQKRIEKHNKMTIDAIDKLKQMMGLTHLFRIEGYDISNISGEFSVASMVVFERGEPAYKEYRKFKIKTVVGANDFASMEEVLKRRLNDYIECKENFSKKPDLILIDGGFGQLHSAEKIINELGLDIAVISLAEKNEEICTCLSNEPIVLDRSNEALKLLERVRDESHRFAITFHRTLRGKSLKSSLSQIEGIGEEKAKLLLKYFKSVEAISKASESDLKKVDGIGSQLAKIIFDFYHKL